jgi:dipeptidyl aminopeptidase/acylaminoacyl peptidase
LTSARDQQIRALYRAALERRPAERSAFVAELSGGDEELRRSVELLLSQQGATDGGDSAESTSAADFPAGTRVAHYRIDGVLGRGGMGVVYRATDTKLNRAVAMKFLLGVVADAQAKRRFQQEAATASGLNHPHIVTVYDVGDHDGREFIVSELVDGGTLDGWSGAARRSWRQSVELLTGVADALAAAHAAGVLHRDVKPGNILIGGNGYAKLADFGLAKLVDNGSGNVAGAPSAASRTTRAGVVVGTVAYMSPEQATGQPLDTRSDVFSFGVVLYELVAGKRPFESANELEELKAIVHAAPAPLPDGVPELLRIVVDKTLEKEPGDRYQTMQDLAADLKRVTRRGSSSAVTATSAAPRRAGLPWLVAAAFALALASTIAAALFWRPTRPVPRAMQFEIDVPGYLRSPALSRDGTMLAYVALTGGVRQIWTRSIGGREARPVPGGEGSSGPFWSPDGRALAVYRDDGLFRIDLSGGGPRALAPRTPAPMAGEWADDGTILFGFMAPNAPNVVVAIGRVPVAGGAVTQLTVPRPSDGNVLPRLLPDGEHFIYLSGVPSANQATINLGSLTRGAVRPLFTITESGAIGRGNRSLHLAYAQGYILYFRDETLVAQPFDADALALRGEPLTLLEGVSEFAVTDDLLVYRASADTRAASDIGSQLTWYDRSGSFLDVVVTPRRFSFPVLSPDGRHVAVSAPGPDSPWSDIWTIELERRITRRQTFDEARDVAAVWSPDGSRIAFASARDAGADVVSSIYERTVDAAAEQNLYSGRSTERTLPNDWSQHGILFQRFEAGKQELRVLPLSGEPPYSLLEFSYPVRPARLSPDGRWLAFSADESDGFQIIVRPFPNVGDDTVQVSTRGGINPRWRADGRELYYLASDGAIMAVEVEVVDGRFRPGAPRPLFATRIPFPTPTEDANHYFDVAPDGERFLLNDPPPESPQPDPDAPTAGKLHVIVNWTSLLRD